MWGDSMMPSFRIYLAKFSIMACCTSCSISSPSDQIFYNPDLGVRLVLQKDQSICELTDAGSLHGFLINIDGTSCKINRIYSNRYAKIVVSSNSGELKNIEEYAKAYCASPIQKKYVPTSFPKFLSSLDKKYGHVARCANKYNSPYGYRIDALYFATKDDNFTIYSKVFTIYLMTFSNKFETDERKVEQIFSQL
jgi:hypothetical protein